MKRDCRGNRLNSGVAEGVQYEGNIWEDEVEVPYVGTVKGGSSCVLNMACELCDACFKMTRTEMLQSKHLSLVGPLSHTHDKNLCKRAR